MAHVETAIEEGTGTCICKLVERHKMFCTTPFSQCSMTGIDISGVPGTGKTATVLEVIRHLQHKSENEVCIQ